MHLILVLLLLFHEVNEIVCQKRCVKKSFVRLGELRSGLTYKFAWS